MSRLSAVLAYSFFCLLLVGCTGSSSDPEPAERNFYKFQETEFTDVGKECWTAPDNGYRSFALTSGHAVYKDKVLITVTAEALSAPGTYPIINGRIDSVGGAWAQLTFLDTHVNGQTVSNDYYLATNGSIVVSAVNSGYKIEFNAVLIHGSDWSDNAKTVSGSVTCL